MTVRYAACCAMMMCLAGAASADEAGVTHGRDFASRACTSCHVADEHGILPPPEFASDAQSAQATSFYDIAHAHGADAAYLRKAITAPEHARGQEWSEADLVAVIDYIQSLPR